MKEQHRQRKIEGMFIPAFVLIGIGVGFLFGRPDIGALVGLGAGFIVIGIAKILISPTMSKSTVLSRSFFPLFIGVVFIIAGFGLVYFPADIWPYIGALALIVAGIWLLFRAMSRHEVEKPDEDD